MKSRLLFLLLLSCSSNLIGQQFVINGRVESASSREALSFATLSLAGGTKGTISNASGAFRLVLKDQDKKDTLKVSYVGYESQWISLSLVESKELVIQLIEKEEKLDEVVVTSLTANRILENAISRISGNYFHSPHVSKGFYRLSSRKNEKYVHLSEVAFDLYRSKEPEEIDLFYLDTWRGITDEKEAHGVDLGMRPSGIFGLDKVNTKGFLKTFGKRKFLKDHLFILEGEYKYEDRTAFLISFDQRDGVKDLGFKGHFYIDKEDFAFLELDYGISPKSSTYYKFNLAYRALMELFGIDIAVLGEKSRVRYQQIGGRYYLKDASLSTDLKFKSSREHYNFVLNTKVDYLVSEVILQNPKRISNDEALAHGKLIEFQYVEYDSLFWSDYNIVLPTTDFNEISNVIIENNRANDTKQIVEGKLKRYPKETGPRVDSILSFYHQKGLFHGNALVESEGKIILKKSYPYHDQQIDSKSRFRIGSISKTFTSMLILMLKEENKLKLSDPVSKYLPDYINGDVTIEQLLSHQSGIPNYLSKNENIVNIFHTIYTIDQLISKFCSDSLEFTPGESFNYSNSGYVVLAKIAEVVSGKTYERLLSERIFKPLEMNNTSFGKKSEFKAPIEGYYYDQPETNYPAENVIGSGGIVSTTEDLLKWSRALENSALINGSIVEESIQPRVAYRDWEADYGYGWMIDKYLFKTSKKHKIIYHPGTDMAFYSMLLKQPDEQISIILLSNTGDFPRFEISDLILEVLN